MLNGGINMTTVLIQDKNFEIKDTLLVKEYSRLMDRLKFIVDIQDKIKNATEQDLMALNSQVQTITSEDWTFARNVVKRCYGLTDEVIDAIHNVDMLYLFDEVRKESSILKKK